RKFNIMGKLNQIATLVALSLFTSFAAAETTQKDLDNIRQEIKQVDKEVSQQKAQQDKLEAQIRQTDKELAKQRAELAKIDSEKQIAVAELQRLQKEASELEERINGMKKQVTRLLESRYRNRTPEAVIMLLQNKNPNEKGRQLQYLRKIQAANQQAIVRLGEQQEELKRQSELINEQMAKIQELINRQQKIIADLERKKKSDRLAVAKLDKDISKNESKIKELREDEQQMSSLLKRISTAKTEKHERQPEKENLPKNTAFSKLQGTLSMPMNGKIVGRFGGEKSSGGNYNGIYIAGNAGTVRSVASGKVAYAQELRGYGNTVVIDHDGEYLSVYSGLSMLAVMAGDSVSPRQQIGVSGAMPNEVAGLYFELRHRSQPINPASWWKK
ncbi:MAG: peptidoglycan DD-metalloendopeptidase family protein, partial [Neisseriaceae bacterium]|nr:peptidoglycan DD-metalloendopeptidase family protein [Neisseriaceae bacterium]